eukprot:TRINITY_DN11840_c0_g1_i1.p1 TRINITY_DN11840_c0_g1~~TRINITY_DN11840_c0_g1_i1.p1  ORF type:complete len:219 (-),score=67.10 TRINITY_DN11840_c0_g1_i1:31-687(-)
MKSLIVSLLIIAIASALVNVSGKYSLDQKQNCKCTPDVGQCPYDEEYTALQLSNSTLYFTPKNVGKYADGVGSVGNETEIYLLASNTVCHGNYDLKNLNVDLKCISDVGVTVTCDLVFHCESGDCATPSSVQSTATSTVVVSETITETVSEGNSTHIITATKTETETTSGDVKPNEDNGMRPGLKWGLIGAGIFVGVVVVGVAAFFVIKNKRANYTRV